MSSLGFFSFPDPRKSSYSHIHCGVTNTERASRRKKGKYKHTFTYTQTIRLKSVIFTLAFKNVKKKKKGTDCFMGLKHFLLDVQFDP